MFKGTRSMSNTELLQRNAAIHHLRVQLGHQPSNANLLITDTIKVGSAMFYFGTVPDKTVKALGRMPSDFEIFIMCDGGLSEFGGTCYINESTGNFSCTVSNC